MRKWIRLRYVSCAQLLTGGTNTLKDRPIVWVGMSYMSPNMTG